MSEEETVYERRLNGLLFEAANKTDDFVRHKIAIIEAGNALQDSYMAALQQCCRKHDEVLKLEEYVLTIRAGAARGSGSRGTPDLRVPGRSRRSRTAVRRSPLCTFEEDRIAHGNPADDRAAAGRNGAEPATPAAKSGKCRLKWHSRIKSWETAAI